VIGPARGVAVGDEDAALVARLRDGEERAFEEAVAGLYPAMLAVAHGYVRTRSVAEEVVQEAWLGVLKGLERFEGRSTLRSWVLRIVANIARDRAVREARSLPFSSLGSDDEEPAVAPERFYGADEPYPGGWRSFPSDWRTLPESRLLAHETLDLVKRAIEDLPEGQRIVITLRDVKGWDADEVCEALEISEVNQRVLLHRARMRVRTRLERHLDG
jgi:RNA polymerase sigma-70 factor (ECF subfamily)